MEKKPFKYYAIRTGNMITFRRTVSHIQRVRSLLYKRNSEFRLEQITYVGGRAIGSMFYTQWIAVGGNRIAENGCVIIPRTKYRALSPYIQTGA